MKHFFVSCFAMIILFWTFFAKAEDTGACLAGWGSTECSTYKRYCEVVSGHVSRQCREQCLATPGYERMLCLEACKQGKNIREAGIKYTAKGVEVVFKKKTGHHMKKNCRAKYVVEGDRELFSLDEFDFYARRGCKASRPNRCRRKARDAVENCMIAHWKLPNGPGPLECYSEGVRDYKVSNLKKTISSAVCPTRLNKVKVYRYTYGNKGCGSRESKSRRELLGEMPVDCR